MIDYVYRSGPRVHSKQPDSSFIPANIQIPPAKPQPGTVRAGVVGVAFPTVVFEVAHCHESWALLLQDAREKAFSRQTSVQLVVGIKLFKHEFKVFWARRGRRGHGMKVMRMTEKIRYDRPTGKFLLLPSRLIFWGCPQAPAHVGNNFRLSLEQYRRYVTARNFV